MGAKVDPSTSNSVNPSFSPLASFTTKNYKHIPKTNL